MAEARVGLSMRMPQQVRTYYGKRIDPRMRFEEASRQVRPRAVAASASNSGSTTRMGLMLAGGSIIAAAGLSAFTSQRVQCESARPYATPSSSPVSVETKGDTTTVSTEPQSIVNVYQLSFGTICGVCAGVFIKKGLKLIAFLLGGCYILLQYLNSQKLVQVNWSAINSRYDKLVGSAAGPETGSVRGYSGSTLQRIWNRTTNFLMADFQPRATFMAGLVLGLRLG